SENVADDKLKETLELLWVDKDLDTKASELSGGEKQRVALGRVLLMEKAEVYLLDEPSSDLDDQTSAHVMKKFIETAKKHNKQMILVTHDKRLSEKFADTVINMDQYSIQIKKEEEELRMVMKQSRLPYGKRPERTNTSYSTLRFLESTRQLENDK